jgi:hypothetical protein
LQAGGSKARLSASRIDSELGVTASTVVVVASAACDAGK